MQRCNITDYYVKHCTKSAGGGQEEEGIFDHIGSLNKGLANKTAYLKKIQSHLEGHNVVQLYSTSFTTSEIQCTKK